MKRKFRARTLSGKKTYIPVLSLLGHTLPRTREGLGGWPGRVDGCTRSRPVRVSGVRLMHLGRAMPGADGPFYEQGAGEYENSDQILAFVERMRLSGPASVHELHIRPLGWGCA